MSKPNTRCARTWLAPLCALAFTALTSCENVTFYEKARLASPLMAFDTDSTRVHALQKVFYSREASVGGIGSTAGGGCGCTN